MKKILLPVIAALSLFFNAAHAQTDNNSMAVADIKGGNVDAALPTPAGADFASTHKAVIKSFSSMYKDVIATESYTLKDKSILIRFYNNGKLYKAFFTNSGVWMHTVCSYEEPYLPSSVRNLVKGTYTNLKITFVDEIQTPGLEPVYRVQLQDDKKIVIVKVCGDEMEVDQKFEKHA